MVVENVFIELITCTISYRVINNGIVINVLMFVGNNTTIQETFATFAAESKVELVACYTVVKCNNIMRHTTIFCWSM